VLYNGGIQHAQQLSMYKIPLPIPIISITRDIREVRCPIEEPRHHLRVARHRSLKTRRLSLSLAKMQRPAPLEQSCSPSLVNCRGRRVICPSTPTPTGSLSTLRVTVNSSLRIALSAILITRASAAFAIVKTDDGRMLHLTQDLTDDDMKNKVYAMEMTKGNGA
jgi:hypothetical protein